MSLCNLIILASVLTFQPDSSGGNATSDLKQFQGAWRAASIINTDGHAATAEELKQTKLVVNGTRFKLTGNDFTITGQFEIDSSKTPKTIDAILDAKKGEQPVKVLGIYRIDGETRKSCFAMPDQPRPNAFPDSPKGFLQLEWKK